MRKPASIAASFSIAFLMLFGTLRGDDALKSAPSPTKIGDYTLSGPYTHENLTLFLIHGKDKLKDKTYLTLQEGMERKIVVVHETGNVNELTIENVSPDQDVYVQSGRHAAGAVG